jgi:transketolase
LSEYPEGFAQLSKLESREVALLAKASALQMTFASKASHIGSSLSMIDILSVISTGVELATNGKLGNELIISKGHAAAGAYAVLAHSGYIPLDLLETYSLNGSPLGGHVTSTHVPVINLSTGSLGHGLPFSVGRALAKKRLGIKGQSFVILSDGECDEGSNWEAALLASHLELENLSVVIDRNFLQSLKSTEETVRLEPLAEKWLAFNWDVVVVDGHSHEELHEAIFRKSNKPKLTIANTVKGYGVSFMENSVPWHYKSTNAEELASALNEIGYSS